MSEKLLNHMPHVSSMQSSSVICKHKAVKLDAKIMDSGVSRNQMWQEKKKEIQEKRRALMRKAEKILLKRSWKPEGKVKKPRAENDSMLQSEMPQRNVGANETSRG